MGWPLSQHIGRYGWSFQQGVMKVNPSAHLDADDADRPNRKARQDVRTHNHHELPGLGARGAYEKHLDKAASPTVLRINTDLGL